MANMGLTDRRIRALVVAPVLLVAGVIAGPAGTVAIVLYVLAVVMVATSIVGFCPLYRLLNIRTRSAPAASR